MERRDGSCYWTRSSCRSPLFAAAEGGGDFPEGPRARRSESYVEVPAVIDLTLSFSTADQAVFGIAQGEAAAGTAIAIAVEPDDHAAVGERDRAAELATKVGADRCRPCGSLVLRAHPMHGQIVPLDECCERTP